MKSTALLTGIIICGLITFFSFRVKKQQELSDRSTINAIQIMLFNNVTGGYGYSISINNKGLVSQPHIPAIQKIEPFINSHDALQTALLVKQKITNHIFPPAISVQELDSMNIKY